MTLRAEQKRCQHVSLSASVKREDQGPHAGRRYVIAACAFCYLSWWKWIDPKVKGGKK